MIYKIKQFWKNLTKIQPREGKIDTSPEEFNKYFKQKISSGMKGGDQFFAVCIAGQSKIPRIGSKFKVWKNREDAEKRRKNLQYENPKLRLEVKRVEIFYIISEDK